MEGETDKKIEELQAQINMLMATKSPTSVWNSSKEQMKTQLRETFLWYKDKLHDYKIGNDTVPTFNGELCNWLLPWYGEDTILEDFGSSQDRYAIYLVKSSGCGKTKLAFSLGLQEGFNVVPIRLHIGTDSRSIILLENTCRKLDVKNRQEHAKICLKLLHIFVLLHAKLYLELIKLARENSCNNRAKHIASISMMNGKSWSLIDTWMVNLFRSPKLNEFEWVKELEQLILDEVTQDKKLYADLNFMLLFDEVSTLKNRGRGFFEMDDSKTVEGTHFFYGLQLLIENWFLNDTPLFGVLCADTTFSIWDEVQMFSKLHSPSRVKWRPFTRFSLFTQDILSYYMKHYFNYNLTTEDIQLAKQFLPVRAVSFYEDFFRELINQIMLSKTEDIPKILPAVLKKSIQNIKDRFRGVITTQATLISHQKTISHKLFRHLVFSNGKYRATSNEVRKFLTSGWLIFDAQEATELEIDMKTEPVFSEALRDYYKVTEVWQQYFMDEHVETTEEKFRESKGAEGEHLIALKLILSTGTTLFSLHEQLSKTVGTLSFLQDWELLVESCIEDTQNESFLKQLTKSRKPNYSLLLRKIAENAGPDLCCFLHHKTDPQKVAILFIQCKIADDPELEKSVYTLNQQYFYKQKTPPSTRILDGPKYAETQDILKQLKEKYQVTFLRAHFSGRTWNVPGVDKYNYNHPEAPFLLWHCYEQVFGTSIHDRITNGLLKTAYKPQKTLEFGLE